MVHSLNTVSSSFNQNCVILILGNLDGYMNISTRLKLGPFEEDCLVRTSSVEGQQGSDEPESPGSGKPCMLFCIEYVYLYY